MDSMWQMQCRSNHFVGHDLDMAIWCGQLTVQMHVQAGPRVTIGCGISIVAQDSQLLFAWPHQKSCTMCMFDYASNDHKVKCGRAPCKNMLARNHYGLTGSMVWRYRSLRWEGQTPSVGSLSEDHVSHKAIDQKVDEVSETTLRPRLSLMENCRQCRTLSQPEKGLPQR